MKKLFLLIFILLMLVGCGTMEIKQYDDMLEVIITEQDYKVYGLTRRDKADRHYMYSFNICLAQFKVFGHEDPFICNIEKHCFVKENPKDKLMTEKPVEMCEILIELLNGSKKEEEIEEEWDHNRNYNRKDKLKIKI